MARNTLDPCVSESELATLAEIGRALLEAQLDEDQLCELIYDLAGQVVSTENFQVGLFDGDRYHIKVWVRDGERQPPATFVTPAGDGFIGWLRASRQPLLVRDFETEMASLPARPRYISSHPPRSAIFLPILVGDGVIGALAIQDPRPNAFDEGHLRLLSVLANQSASAINNARLYAHGQHRLNDLTAVSEVGRKLTSILDLNQLLTQVVELIRSRFGYYHVQVFLVERGSDRAQFRASSGCELNEKWLREGRTARIGQEGIIGWVAQHGEVLLANDVSAEPRYIPDDPRLLPDTRAELAVPLLMEGQVVGVLDVQSTEAGAFGPDDIFILQTLADQVAVAVGSARAYEAQREEAWVTTVMLQVAEATSQADGFDAVLDGAVRVTAMLAGVESCSIWLWDDELEAFQHGASFGLLWEKLIGDLEEDPRQEDEGRIPAPPRPEGGLGEALHEVPAPRPEQRSRDGLTYGAPRPERQSRGGLPRGERAEQSLGSRLRFLPGDWPALDRLRAGKTPVVVSHPTEPLPAHLEVVCPGDVVVLLPMLNKGQVFGAMGVSIASDRTPSLTDRRLAMLGGIAYQVAAAVDNSRLSAAREEEVWISTVLLQVAEAIRRLQPLDDTLVQVARLAAALTGVDRCAILLREEDGSFRTRTIHSLQPGLADAYSNVTLQPGDLPLLDNACRLGQPQVVDDACSSDLVPEAWQQRFNSCTLLAIPILVADEVIGALLADDVGTTHMFSPRRVRILSGIADQTAVAIENTRLQAQEAERARLNREIELAHDIQRSLLPAQPPHLPGYQIAYRWRAARGVGGDFFDFIPLGPDRLGMVIADVSDKGIPAALYMMFSRTLLRTMAFSGREPAAALMRTNELIVADSTSDMFVTAYYSVLDGPTHVLTYASAGHNLAFHTGTGSPAVERLTTAGIPLGVIAEAEIEQKALELAPGDVILFYTDGVTDAVNPAGDLFGEDRLTELLAAHREEPADTIADAIEAAVQAFAGDLDQYDDLTLVLVKRADEVPSLGD